MGGLDTIPENGQVQLAHNRGISASKPLVNAANNIATGGEVTAGNVTIEQSPYNKQLIHRTKLVKQQ